MMFAAVLSVAVQVIHVDLFGVYRSRNHGRCQDIRKGKSSESPESSESQLERQPCSMSSKIASWYDFVGALIMRIE